ncbi:MAG: gas vesicle protein [Myxococcota bacterium]|nr:gas vesicle protein [Myxococcota bacterium]
MTAERRPSWRSDGTGRDRRLPRRPSTLCEALDRLLDTGAVVCGDLVISVADVDLLYLNLRLFLTSVETLLEDEAGPVAAPPSRCAGQAQWSGTP